MKHSSDRSAFTLVELAIVLVIIGLIVGGVLVGQDLIHAAQVRSVVTDIEKYNAAANTFQGKYSGLPGDLLNSKAVEFGFNTTLTDAARDGSFGHGDGDGMLIGCTNAGHPNLGCETVLFWTDLSKAQLITFSEALNSVDGIAQPNLSTGDLTNGILPKTRLRDNVMIAVFSTNNGHNYFAGGDLMTSNNFGPIKMTRDAAHNYQSGFTPLEASSIDNKLDDGEPLTGAVTAFIRYLDQPDTAGNYCTNADSHYSTTTDSLANAPSCGLAFRTSF